ncbi:class I SAM-dependent methyltransferase [Dyadobacter pollutisoli]|uniref:Methyltransferase domain-containing protein n=1 Tax=Dyadobacter pollutisoli TaxID=2910158 RepID=A0A9E8SPJ1_9BACT|nr:methyltransferase domain-containing protein [Dyadobacter pollutisoli]WAC14791.1 methyltransferase domain-containing protein [Dyadobacter pollutisoli]
MTNQEAISLISKGIPQGSKPQKWADLGCGGGTFTVALATILPFGSQIVAVDKSMQQLEKTMGNGVSVNFIQADFEQIDLELTDLDGILLANSLHYVKDKITLIQRLEKYLITDKRFLIVEYDTLSANKWVPYPIDFIRLEELFADLNYRSVVKLSERKSLYGRGNLYAAAII